MLSGEGGIAKSALAVGLAVDVANAADGAASGAGPLRWARRAGVNAACLLRGSRGACGLARAALCRAASARRVGSRGGVEPRRADVRTG